jgi:flavorubredoxin
MHCVYKVTDNMYWIGGNERKLSVFEGVIPMPEGMAYNSYFIDDEKTVVLDTVDQAVSKVFYENVDYLLGGRKLDYIIVNHVEPDHSASLEDLILRHPEAVIVGTAKIKQMVSQYVTWDIESRFLEVKEGDELSTGEHTFTFVGAPMVHWPEVMVTFEKTTGTLFSADAFGIFGAHNGNIFADQYDFDLEWLPSARKYYTTIVGKYGKFTANLINKAAGLDIKMICPLHGFIIRKDFDKYINAYMTWAKYESEVSGVLLLYASPYGNTKNAAEILACEMAQNGVDKMRIMDVSHEDPMDVLPEAFKYSHIVIAATTYNAEIFIKMQEAMVEMKSMGVSNKKVSIIQNGSWNAASGKKVKEFFEEMNNIEFVGDIVTVKSSVKEDTREALETLAKEIAASVAEEKA